MSGAPFLNAGIAAIQSAIVDLFWLNCLGCVNVSTTVTAFPSLILWLIKTTFALSVSMQYSIRLRFDTCRSLGTVTKFRTLARFAAHLSVKLNPSSANQIILRFLARTARLDSCDPNLVRSHQFAFRELW